MLIWVLNTGGAYIVS